MSRDEAKAVVLAVLKEEFGIDSDVSEDQVLDDSVGIDSLDRLNLIMKLEEELGEPTGEEIQIPDSKTDGVETLGELIDLVVEIMSE